MLVLAEMGYRNFCNHLPVYEGGARIVKLIFLICNSAGKFKLVNTSKTKVNQIGLHLQILQLRLSVICKHLCRTQIYPKKLETPTVFFDIIFFKEVGLLLEGLTWSKPGF